MEALDEPTGASSPMRRRDIRPPSAIRAHWCMIMTNIMTNRRTTMGSFNLAQAKANLSELVNRAQSGEETVIMRRGRPVARLVPFAPPKDALRSRAAFRASLIKTHTPSARLIRKLRDEGY